MKSYIYSKVRQTDKKKMQVLQMILMCWNAIYMYVGLNVCTVACKLSEDINLLHAIINVFQRHDIVQCINMLQLSYIFS